MKTIDLIRDYWLVIEESKPEGICKICNTEFGAKQIAERCEQKTGRKFFVKKEYSWNIGNKLHSFIEQIGTKALKKAINEVNGFTVFKVD